MKTLKKELEENSQIVSLDCNCCSDEVISLSLVFQILRERNIEVEE